MNRRDPWGYVRKKKMTSHGVDTGCWSVDVRIRAISERSETPESGQMMMYCYIISVWACDFTLLVRKRRTDARYVNGVCFVM